MKQFIIALSAFVLITSPHVQGYQPDFFDNSTTNQDFPPWGYYPDKYTELLTVNLYPLLQHEDKQNPTLRIFLGNASVHVSELFDTFKITFKNLTASSVNVFPVYSRRTGLYEGHTIALTEPTGNTGITLELNNNGKCSIYYRIPQHYACLPMYSEHIAFNENYALKNSWIFKHISTTVTDSEVTIQFKFDDYLGIPEY